MNTTFITENLPDFVNTIIPKKSNVPYVIYNLNPNFDSEINDDSKNNYYRSAIVGEGKLLCMAPSKSISNDKFQSVVGEKASIKTEEIIEGTMINLFWDERVGWEIATKKSIGGNTFYFRNHYDTIVAEQKTFRQMFLDVFGQHFLGDLPLLNVLDKSCCYTFVLQHPLNHIVLNIDKPSVYLVHSYKLDGMNYQYSDEQNPEFLNYGVKFPLRIDNHNMDPSCPGYVITDLNSGLRTVVKNPYYEELKTLRGNNPNLFFHYLMLRKTNDVQRFLQNFPQYSDLFQMFQNNFVAFVASVYQMYVDIHILKIKNVKDIENRKVLFFVEKLHYTVYLPSLKTESKIKITPKVVEAFLDKKEYMMPI
jgi:hypothetical protein